MNTFLGAAQYLPPSALDEAQIARRGDPLSRRLSVGPGDAARRDGAGDRGRARGRAARSPSPCPTRFCVDRHRDGFNAADRRAARSTSCSPTRPRSRRWPAVPHLEERGRGGRAARSRRWSSPAASTARSRCAAASAPTSPAEPIAQAGRHDRRRRPVRRRLPGRRRARARASRTRSGSARSPPPK